MPVGRLLTVEALNAGYVLENTVVRAVRGVSFSLDEGEFLGIAGESGCGKSTLAFALAGLLSPPGEVFSGDVVLDGRPLLDLDPETLRQMRWKDFSTVFQSSMNVLNPVMRVKDQIADAMLAHVAMPAAEVAAQAAELLRMVNITPEYLNAYPHQLSGGMRQRVVIAIALALGPKLVVMDEPTTALDVVVQRTILQEIDELRGRLGFSIIFITHDLSLLVQISDTIAIMYAGKMVEKAPSETLYTNPLHPYTQGLLRSFPPLVGARKRLHGITGHPPDLSQEVVGCPFAPRCPMMGAATGVMDAEIAEHEEVAETCETVEPAWEEVEPGHFVACHLTHSDADGLAAAEV